MIQLPNLFAMKFYVVTPIISVPNDRNECSGFSSHSDRFDCGRYNNCSNCDNTSNRCQRVFIVSKVTRRKSETLEGETEKKPSELEHKKLLKTEERGKRKK